MGIIIRQASISSALSYLGVGLGFLNVAIFMNRWLEPDELGLRNVLLDIAVIFSQFANLGMYKGMVKFFPFFLTKDNKDRGLLMIAFYVSLIGFSIIGGGLLFFQNEIASVYAKETSLFSDYYWAIFPLALLLIVSGLLESYLQARSETVISSFAKNLLHRLITTILIFCYFFGDLSFSFFIILFIASYGVNIILYYVYLKKYGLLDLKVDYTFFSKRVRRIYFSYSAYSILSSFSSILVTRVDIIMIGYYLGLTSIAIYSNAFFLTALLMVPSVAVSNITLPLLSSSWKNRDIPSIDSIYKKTSITQFLIGGSIFILMWSSIDNFFELQREEYASGKMVFFCLGTSKVINLIFGVNHQIINITKYYKFDSYSSFVLAIGTIISNIFMIKYYGILGAAAATAFSLIIFNLIRSYFIYVKLNVQPFSIHSLKALGVLVLAYIIGQIIPKSENIFIDTLIRSTTVGGFILFMTLKLNLSEDFDRLFLKGMVSIKKFLN